MSDVAKCPLCEKYIDITIKPDKCVRCEADLKNHDLSPQIHKSSTHLGPVFGLIVAIPMFFVGAFIASEVIRLPILNIVIPAVLAGAVYKFVDSYFDKREESIKSDK